MSDSDESRKRTQQFNEKMSTLNRDFLKSLRIWYEQCPHYDFSSTVGSYLKHVDGLERQFGLKETAEEGDENKPLNGAGGGGGGGGTNGGEHRADRKIAKARRRLKGDPSKLNDSIAVSTPAGAPPRFSLGNVSAIAPSAQQTPKTVGTEPPAGPGGRKRVIRGGGPTGDSESVHFRGTDSTSPSITVPPVTIQLPKLTAGFWDKHKDEHHQGIMPKFNLVAPEKEVLPPGQDSFRASGERKHEEAPPAKAAFSFGSRTEPTESPRAGEKEQTKTDVKAATTTTATAPPMFGAKTAESGKPGFSFGGFSSTTSSPKKSGGADSDAPPKPPATISFPAFGAKKDESKEAVDSPKLTFGAFGAKKDDDVAAATTSTTTSPITFGGFGAKKEAEGAADKPKLLTFPAFGAKATTTAEGEKPALSFPAFGSTGPKLTFGGAAPTTLSFGGAPGGLTFGAAAGQSGENKDAAAADDDEAAEYVPPKAEVVENEEPGATYSVKCSVFKMVDKRFEKMGVGMMHLKETDGGSKSLLVRAATAIGTVWINARISASMKVAKADDKGDKLRLTVPLSATEMGVFLVRFANVASAEKVFSHIEENSK